MGEGSWTLGCEMPSVRATNVAQNLIPYIDLRLYVRKRVLNEDILSRLRDTVMETTPQFRGQWTFHCF